MRFLYFALEQLVRAEGASTIYMNGMFISVIVNVILDPTLIFSCHLGIVGAIIGIKRRYYGKTK